MLLSQNAQLICYAAALYRNFEFFSPNDMAKIKYFVNMVSGQWIDVFPSDLLSKVSTLAPPSRVRHKFHSSILYIIFYIETNIYKYLIKKNFAH